MYNPFPMPESRPPRRKFNVLCPVGCGRIGMRDEKAAGEATCKSCNFVFPYDNEGKIGKPYPIPKPKKNCTCASCKQRDHAD